MCNKEMLFSRSCDIVERTCVFNLFREENERSADAEA